MNGLRAAIPQRPLSPVARVTIPINVSPKAASRRFLFLDAARGLLLFLMVSCHSVAMAKVGTGSFLQSHWWLPGGWATQNFATISGFTLAWLYAGTASAERVERNLPKRACKLLAVMFLSNVVFLLMRYCVLNELAKALQWNWWAGLFTFRTEYSISGALFPIAVFLLFAPLLLRAAKSSSAVPLILGLFLFGVLAWAFNFAIGARAANPRLLDVLFVHGAGGYATIPLASNGGLGFALGLILRRAGPHWGKRWNLFFGAAVVLEILTPAIRGTVVSPLSQGILSVMSVLGHVGLVLLLGFLLELVPFQRILTLLGHLGKYGLLCFIAHRMVLQILSLLQGHLAPSSPAFALYWAYLICTLVVLVGICRLRNRSPRFNQALAKVFL